MSTEEELKEFQDSLNEFCDSSKVIYNNVALFKKKNLNSVLVEGADAYLANERDRMKTIENSYELFLNQVEQAQNSFQSQVQKTHEADQKEFSGLADRYSELIDDIKKKKDLFEKKTVPNEYQTAFVYSDNSKSDNLNIELICQYPGSYFYKEYISMNRNKEGNIYIDHPGKNDELIAKYMKNDKSLNEDIERMNINEKKEFLNDLNWAELPIKMEFVKKMSCNEENEIMEAWRNRQVRIGGVSNHFISREMKENGIMEDTYNDTKVGEITYDKGKKEISIDSHLNLEYIDVIEDYIKNGKKQFNIDLIKQHEGDKKYVMLEEELSKIGLAIPEEERDRLLDEVDERYLVGSNIIMDTKYNDVLKEWIGDYKMKMIYRASENEFSAKSFHEKCDSISGPTLVLIRSTDGWLFGGFTTMSWGGSM